MTTSSWVRHPTLLATKDTVPAAAERGTTPRLIREPIGASPPIIRVMPMSASRTRTVAPGKVAGAEQDSRE